MRATTHSGTDRQTDGRQDDANSRSYCVAVRSAKTGQCFSEDIRYRQQYGTVYPFSTHSDYAYYMTTIVLIIFKTHLTAMISQNDLLECFLEHVECTEKKPIIK